mmetsp:Transcript_27291/g.53353  ORF Transcript_27291/g.53353 Transcript_27291/m.53353 type:complete len:215 (+) Transcript_27291:544-1188(+)
MVQSCKHRGPADSWCHGIVVVDATGPSLRAVRTDAEQVLLPKKRVPQAADHGPGLVFQRLREDNMPQLLLGKVPQDCTCLADLVHQAQSDGLFCVIEGQDLHSSKIQAPGWCFAKQRKHAHRVAKNDSWCAVAERFGKPLQVFNRVATRECSVRIVVYTFKLHPTAFTLEALQPCRVRSSADVEVLPEVACCARRQDHSAQACLHWASRCAQQP